MDKQSFSASLLQVVLTPETLQAMLADGGFVETVRAGDVLNRGRIATGENAEKVRRLALALTDPQLVIKSIPVDAETTPYIAVGDLVLPAGVRLSPQAVALAASVGLAGAAVSASWR